MILMGKHHPTYTPHVDTGDFVVVTNAEKVVMTGTKMERRHYAWYNGYTGQKMESYQDRQARKPRRSDFARRAPDAAQKQACPSNAWQAEDLCRT